MTIVKHELRQGAKTLLIWSLAIGFLLAISIVLFPEMKEQMAQAGDMFASMGSFTEAFGMDRLDFSVYKGYYAVECANVLGMGGAFFASLIAVGILSKEERDETAEFLLTHPVSRVRILNEKLKNREIHKYYLCVVHGTLKEKSGILVSYMIKDEKDNKVRVYDDEVPGGKTMKTGYSVLSEKNGLSLVEVELFTGRTHQIRAQFSHIGHPLLGDGKYGTNALNKRFGYKKQFLYSYKLKFDFSGDAGILDYLSGREFEAEDVWFNREFLSGELWK